MKYSNEILIYTKNLLCWHMSNDILDSLSNFRLIRPLCDTPFLLKSGGKTYVQSQGHCLLPYLFHIGLLRDKTSPDAQTHLSSLTFLQFSQWPPIQTHEAGSMDFTKWNTLRVLMEAKAPPLSAHALAASAGFLESSESQKHRLPRHFLSPHWLVVALTKPE